MDIEAVLDRLLDAGISVWLDAEGKVRIDKGAPEDLKDLVREHKQELIDVRRAQALMNSAGMRIICLPLGHRAVAYPSSAKLDEVRWAMHVLRMNPVPLVINDEGLRWISYGEWRRRQPVCTRQDREAYLRQQREAERQEKPLRRRRTA